MRLSSKWVFSALKPELIHHFLHLKMPVPIQEYDSSCPFIFWCVLSFDFTMWLWTFRLDYPLSSVFLWFYFLHDIKKHHKTQNSSLCSNDTIFGRMNCNEKVSIKWHSSNVYSNKIYQIYICMINMHLYFLNCVLHCYIRISNF